MIRRTPRSTRTDTLFPYTTLFRSLVATPIGNLGDISRRALDVLRRADRIACEDTRVTRKLLSAEGIATPLTAYHAHSSEGDRRRLLQAVAGGQALGLVTAAGPPLDRKRLGSGKRVSVLVTSGERRT